jgi:hypothetical protein
MARNARSPIFATCLITLEVHPSRSVSRRAVGKQVPGGDRCFELGSYLRDMSTFRPLVCYLGVAKSSSSI